MLRNLLNRWSRKSGLATPETWLKGVFGVEETYSGVEVTTERALTSSTVVACVRLLSESVASLPLHVYQRAEGGSKLKAPEHPLYSLLHDKPNAYQTSYVWRCQMLAHVLLHGNAYSVIERNAQGRIVGLWPVDPGAVTVRNKDGELVYEVWAGGERRQFYYGEVLHVRGPSLDGITGMSIIKLARQGVGLDLAMTQHGASLFKNGARPGLVLKHPEKLNDVSRDNLRTSFAERFAGALNSGKVFVLEGGLEVQTLGFSSDDAQFLQSRQFSVQDLCRFFRVPPHMVGDPTRLAYASSEAEMLSFMQHSLRPHLVNVEAEINATLFPDRTRYFAEFDANAIARGDQATRYESYSKGLAAGFLTVADVRAWENLPYLPGTDQLNRPANMLPTGGDNGTV